MKILLIFGVFLYFLSVYAQKSPQYEQEITLRTENVPGQTTIIFTLNSIGTVWANSSITNSYLIAKDTTFGNTAPSSYNHGWRIFWEQTDSHFDPYAHGIYKLSSSYGTNFVYIDFRDCKYANQSYSGQQYSSDFYLKYNAQQDDFYFYGAYSNDYQLIQDQDIIPVWIINNQGIPPNTSCFSNFWENCLVLIEHSIQLRLVLGPHQTFSTTNFKIYRASSLSPANPSTLQYYLIHTTSNNTTFNYVDQDIIGSGQIYFYYYVKAYNSQTISYSECSNYVSANGKLISIQKPILSDPQNDPEIFQLQQNFPNPFNSYTVIPFVIAQKSFVTLEIYDLHGNCIAILIKQVLDKGSYSIPLKSVNLNSGVYFFRLQSADYTYTKRMLLIK